MTDAELAARVERLEAWAERVERWADAYGARLDDIDERTAIRAATLGHVLQTRQIRPTR